MQTSDCLGCFERLSLRKMGRSSMSKIFATVNKQVNTALLRSTHQPTMVSGAFITEGQSPRKRRVMHKQLRIRKQRLQKFGGFLRLKRAMKVRDQVGRREMCPPVSGITTGRNGRCVCRPHPRGRKTSRKQFRRVSPSPFD